MSWEYQEVSGKFIAFSDAAVVEQLEAAWAAQKKSIHIHMGKFKYVVDLEHMVQRNETTGTERILRRRGPAGTVDVGGRVAVWSWEAHGAGSNPTWTPFYPHLSDVIENAFMDDKLEVELEIPVSAHETISASINLGRFEQTTALTGRKRKVRRTIVVQKVHTDGCSPGGRRARSSSSPAAAGGSASAAAFFSSHQVPFTSVSSKDFIMLHDTVLALLPPPQWLAAAAAKIKAKQSIAIAGFDLDDTILTTKSGNVFPKTALDFKMIDPEITAKMKELAESNVIVAFSNQLGVSKDASKSLWVREKIVSLINDPAFKTNIAVFCPTENDKWRKPWPFLFHLAMQQLGLHASVDLSKSFFVGDAAGRSDFTTLAGTTLAGRKKDFSASDRMFAHNVGLRFLTPEAFLGRPDGAMGWGTGVSPEEMAAFKSPAARPPKNAFLPAGEQQEVVVLVCFPGGGKSSFAKTFFESNNYVRVNRDTLGTKEKCVKACEDALSGQKNVVVDNTNPDVASRTAYINVAKKHGASVRCIHLSTSLALAQHLNEVRGLFGGGPKVPAVAYHTFQKTFVAPDEQEGFDEVRRVAISADTEGLSDEQKLALFSLS